MVKSAKKPKLRAMMNAHNERTRVRVVAGYLTADVGPRAVVISKPRHATEEDRAMVGHADDEGALDTVIVRFGDDGKVTIESHVMSMGKGTL